MENAILTLLGVLVGGAMVACGVVLHWLLIRPRYDEDICGGYDNRVAQQMAEARGFALGQQHAEWRHQIETHGPWYLDDVAEQPERGAVVVVVSPEQAVALARR